MSFRRLCLLFAFAATTATATTSAHAWCELYGAPLSYRNSVQVRTSIPFYIYSTDGTFMGRPVEYAAHHLRRAINRWFEHGGGTIRMYYAGVTTSLEDHDRYVFRADDNDFCGAFACADPSWDYVAPDGIRFVGGTYFIAPTATFDSIARVGSHELGHLLGLDHCTSASVVNGHPIIPRMDDKQAMISLYGGPAMYPLFGLESSNDGSSWSVRSFPDGYVPWVYGVPGTTRSHSRWEHIGVSKHGETGSVLSLCPTGDCAAPPPTCRGCTADPRLNPPQYTKVLSMAGLPSPNPWHPISMASKSENEWMLVWFGGDTTDDLPYMYYAITTNDGHSFQQIGRVVGTQLHSGGRVGQPIASAAYDEDSNRYIVVYQDQARLRASVIPYTGGIRDITSHVILTDAVDAVHGATGTPGLACSSAGPTDNCLVMWQSRAADFSALQFATGRVNKKTNQFELGALRSTPVAALSRPSIVPTGNFWSPFTIAVKQADAIRTYKWTWWANGYLHTPVVAVPLSPSQLSISPTLSTVRTITGGTVLRLRYSVWGN